MTKGELLRLLEPLGDSIEILVDLSREFAIVAITRPIEAISYVTWYPNNLANAEIRIMVGQ